MPEGIEKKEPSYIVAGNVIGVAIVENYMQFSQKTKNRATM